MASWSWHKYIVVSFESAWNIKGLFMYNSFIFILNIISASSFQLVIILLPIKEIRVHSLWCVNHGLCWAFDGICSLFLSLPGLLLASSAVSSIPPSYTLVSSFRISNMTLICSSYMCISKKETLSFPQAWHIIHVNSSILDLCVGLYW